MWNKGNTCAFEPFFLDIELAPPAWVRAPKRSIKLDFFKYLLNPEEKKIVFQNNNMSNF